MNELTNILEYTKLHYLSLQQDSDELQNYFNSVEDFESDEYRQKEIEDIRLTGQMAGVKHILEYIEDLTNPLTKE